MNQTFNLLFLSYLRLSNAESLCLNIPWRDWFRAEYKHLRASPSLTPVSTPHSVECPSVRRPVVTVTSREPRTVVPATSARRTGRTPAPAKARPRPVSRPRPRSMLELQTKVREDFTITEKHRRSWVIFRGGPTTLSCQNSILSCQKIFLSGGAKFCNSVLPNCCAKLLFQTVLQIGKKAR